MPDPVCPSAFARGAVLLRELPNRLRRPVAPGTYSAEIDGLRFVAIAIVVVGHFMERGARFFPDIQPAMASHPLAALLLRAGLGVHLFFVISGFIITRQVMKARTTPLGVTFLKAYFGRRILRIEPPYMILLVATWLVFVAVGYTPDKTNHFDVVPHSLVTSLIGSIFYLHDLVWGTYPRLFPPGWSLEIEVQFYVLAPLLFWAFFKARSARVRIALGALGLFGGALLSLTAPQDIGSIHTNNSIFRFFHFFWLGLLLAHLHDWFVAKAGRMSPILTGGVGWLGLAVFLLIPDAPDNDLVPAMAIRAATLVALAAIFFSAFARGSSFRAFCERPWISLIGGACYSIYLTHLQVIQAMTGLFAKVTPHAGVDLILVYLLVEIVAVATIGMIFYGVIERTFMIKDWPRRLASSIKASCSVFAPQTFAGRADAPREPN